MEIRPYSQLSEEARASFVRWLLFVDPPDHTRLRGLGPAQPSPRTRSRRSSHACERSPMSCWRRSPVSQRLTSCGAFTSPLPVYAIGELLGLPRGTVGVAEVGLRRHHRADRSAPRLRRRRRQRPRRRAQRLLHRGVEQRRVEPRDDLISVLAAPQTTASGWTTTSCSPCSDSCCSPGTRRPPRCSATAWSPSPSTPINAPCCATTRS